MNYAKLARDWIDKRRGPYPDITISPCNSNIEELASLLEHVTNEAVAQRDAARRALIGLAHPRRSWLS
jgi:hypothetical protein